MIRALHAAVILALAALAAAAAVVWRRERRAMAELRLAATWRGSGL